MTYETTPTPPEAPRIGGRPRLWGDLADAIRAASPAWVIVPAEGRTTTNEALMVTLRRTYFPSEKLASRNSTARNADLYVKLVKPKETAK